MIELKLLRNVVPCEGFLPRHQKSMQPQVQTLGASSASPNIFSEGTLSPRVCVSWEAGFGVVLFISWSNTGFSMIGSCLLRSVQRLRLFGLKKRLRHLPDERCYWCL